MRPTLRLDPRVAANPASYTGQYLKPVFERRRGGKTAKRAAQAAEVAPFGDAFIVARRSVTGWTEDNDWPDYDYGVVTLNKTFDVGAFGLLIPSDSLLDNTKSCLIGGRVLVTAIERAWDHLHSDSLAAARRR